jgi:hypothetical protein
MSWSQGKQEFIMARCPLEAMPRLHRTRHALERDRHFADHNVPFPRLAYRHVQRASDAVLTTKMGIYASNLAAAARG